MTRKKGIIIDYNRIEKQIWQLAEPLVAANGAELIDVEYVLEAGQWYLRLYVDREPPVDHRLCECVSNAVSAALDDNDPIEQSYNLEVSSPGLERPLKRQADFDRYAGYEVLIGLYAPRGGRKEYRGILQGLHEDTISILMDGELGEFKLDEVARVRLAVDW
ncbi:MAG: ribosome maturation factor RimP [Bacillota bacterium]|nr:ribosome maturation factor RimP [Bacillota bacterium]